MLFGVAVELMHGGLALLIVRPFSEAVDIVVTSIPPMIVAVSLGIGVSMVIIHSVKEPAYLPQEKAPEQTQKEQKPPVWTINLTTGTGWARFTGWLNKSKNRPYKSGRGQ
jgi:hypothetical protein